MVYGCERARVNLRCFQRFQGREQFESSSPLWSATMHFIAFPVWIICASQPQHCTPSSTCAWVLNSIAGALPPDKAGAKSAPRSGAAIKKLQIKPARGTLVFRPAPLNLLNATWRDFYDPFFSQNSGVLGRVDVQNTQNVLFRHSRAGGWTADFFAAAHAGLLSVRLFQMKIEARERELRVEWKWQ